MSFIKFRPIFQHFLLLQTNQFTYSVSCGHYQQHSKSLNSRAFCKQHSYFPVLYFSVFSVPRQPLSSAHFLLLSLFLYFAPSIYMHSVSLPAVQMQLFCRPVRFIIFRSPVFFRLWVLSSYGWGVPSYHEWVLSSQALSLYFSHTFSQNAKQRISQIIVQGFARVQNFTYPPTRVPADPGTNAKPCYRIFRKF